MSYVPTDRPTVLSVFPGIGLLDRAFESEGFCIVRGPDVLWGGDVRAFHPPAGIFDGVIGGPPCQSHSSLVHLVRARGNEPRFPDLIPEFSRIVIESAPHWLLMENVPGAPLPDLSHAYSLLPFLLDNADLDSGDGLGHEQMRTRRFTFGVRHPYRARDLRQWIQLAVLRLPKVSGAVTQTEVNNSPEAKGRTLKSAVIGHGGPTPQQRFPQRLRRHTVVGGRAGITAESERRRRVRLRQNAVCGGTGKALEAIASGGGFKRHSLEDALRLQGLPEDFFKHSPFTKDAQRDVIAAGVPLSMGRAIACAVRHALALSVKSEALA